MLNIKHRSPRFAGVLLCPVLLAATPAFPQQIVRSAGQPQPIISLAPSPRPQGLLLARQATDARFENAPANYHVFAAATVGEDAGAEILTLDFAAETRLTRIGSKNKDFVIEPGGTCVEGNSYARGGSCALIVRFNPQGPGHRLGFIAVENSADATPFYVGLTGNGHAPVVSFTPSVISTVTGTAGTINGATSLAVDGGDIVYIADTGNNQYKQIDSSGAITPITSITGPPLSIAVDSFGFLYNVNESSNDYFSIIDPNQIQIGFNNNYASGNCTVNAPCPLTTVGMGDPRQLSIDANDNLFFEETTMGAAEMPVANGPILGYLTLELWYLNDPLAQYSFAVDALDNLYAVYKGSNTECWILEESAHEAETAPTDRRVAGGSTCGFSGDGGQARGAEISSTIGQIAFDIAGNLYFADTGNQRVRRIDAATGVISTIAGNGTQGYAGDGGTATYANLSNPTGVTVDSQGQVYILSNAPSAGPTQALRKVGVTGVLGFGNQLRGSTSVARVVNISNTGNDTLTLSTAPILSGANPSDFAINPTTTNCVLTAGATLAAGKSCKIGIVFSPSVAGARSASLVLEDNTIAGSNTVQLSGAGTLPAPTMSITSPTSTASLTVETPFTFAVSVTSTSATKPTGTVTFKVNGTAVGSPVTLSTSGAASTSITESVPGSYTLSAVYSGDANYAPLTVSETVNVTLLTPTMSISSPASGTPLTAGTAFTFSVSVTSTSSTKPTGMVTFKVNGTPVGSSVTLSSSGTASTQVTEQTSGSYLLLVYYPGDSNFLPAAVSENVNVAAAAKAPVTMKLVPAGETASGCGVASFSVQVSSPTGGTPTGEVELVSSAAVLASAPLINGAATFPPPRTLTPGSHTFVAQYGGDSLHQAATSSAVVVAVSSNGSPCNTSFGAEEPAR